MGEFAVQVGGLRNVILEALRSLSVSSPVNADLVKIIRQLEITPQTEEALETLIWGRSNDIQFAIASPMLNAEYIVAKLQEIIKTNPMSLVEKAKAKVCGQTPFNVNYAFEYLPYKAIVPSEMGFPIFIESQATGLIHARGDLALKCNSPVPELEATIIKKAAYSYSGYVGHICPFIASETMVQEAGFVCLPAAAAEAKDILRRIHLGQDCNELNSMTVTFTTRVRVAKQCTRQ